MFNSTFGSFTTARLGMASSQLGLNITGQNIANIGTTGYTRQRIDQVSLKVNGLGYNESSYSIKIGSGSLVTGTSQLRDPYLDKRFRTEMGYVGEYDIKGSGLKEIEEIIGEVSKVDDKGGIHNQLGDFLSKLQELSKNVGNKENDSMVKTSAEELVRLFNSYSKQFTEVRNNLENQLEKVDIASINDILSKIKELNKSIKINESHGDSALELKDQRNQLIDELSTYAKISVTYRPVKIAEGITVEELQVQFVGADGNRIDLVNDDEIAQLEASKDEETGKWSITLVGTDGETRSDITENFATGSLKSSLELLNNNGEFDNPSTTKGIGYYSKMIDKLANQFATEFNRANNNPDADPPITDNNLFESKDDGPITAGNIKIADGWANNSYGITATKKPDAAVGANDNILEMIALMTKKLEYTTGENGEGTKLFDGSFQEFFTNLSNTLSLEIKSNNEILNNHIALSQSTNNAKLNISGVSLDEEGMNMMKYSQAYAASAKMMTTLDEALDVLINKTGIVGR